MASNSKMSRTNDDPKSGIVKPPTPFEIMLQAMANDAMAEDASFGGDDLNAILSAETEQELFESDDRPPLNFQHLAGCELSIIGFDVKFSRANNSSIQTPFVWRDDRGNEKKMYLLVKCVRISDSGNKKSVVRLPAIGEAFTANTSARYVVAKLWRAMILGLVDENAGRSWECMVQETELGDETAVLKLKEIPKRVTASTVNQ